MEENLERNVVEEKAEANTVPEKSGEKILQKIKNKITLLISPERRKKTTTVAVLAVIAVVILCTFFTLTSPKNIAERFVKAAYTGNEKAVSRLVAYDNKEAWLTDNTEEKFFYRQSRHFDTDINSWNDFYKAIKEERRENMEDSYGDYKITVKAKRSNNISVKKLTDYDEFGSLNYVERYGFDVDEASAFKKVNVSLKISGDYESERILAYVYLAKVHGFWKVLGANYD